MTRILTIIALLFATPAWAVDYLYCSGELVSDGSAATFTTSIVVKRNPTDIKYLHYDFSRCKVRDDYYHCKTTKKYSNGLGETFVTFQLNRVSLHFSSIEITNMKGDRFHIVRDGFCEIGKKQI